MMSVAKAMLFAELGELKPSDPDQAQAAFDDVKRAQYEKAVRLEKNLERLGYKVNPSSE